MPKTKKQSVDKRRKISRLTMRRKNAQDLFVTEIWKQQPLKVKNIVRGSHHQGSETYMFAGLQCTFMCISALLKRLNIDFLFWTAKICDKILENGNGLFEDHIKQTGNDPSMMLIDELPSNICFQRNMYCFNHSSTYTGIISQDISNPPYYSFKCAVELAFQETRNCLLIVSNSASVIMKDGNNNFGIFDSHSRGKSGLFEGDGRAMLIQFDSLVDTINYLKLLWGSMNLQNHTAFEVTAVNIKKLTVNSSLKRKSSISRGKGKKIKLSACSDSGSKQMNCNVTHLLKTSNCTSKHNDSNEPAVSCTEGAILSFKKSVSIGPVYVCTCCTQTWFRHSVKHVNRQKKKEAEIAKKYFIGQKSVDKKEWVCQTCWTNVQKDKMPACAVKNQNYFPKIPNQLRLTSLEERLISPRIPFMQIRERPRGGQLSIKGNVVNVPSDVTSTVNALPRNLRDSDTIAVKLKRKLSFDHYVYHETIRPSKVYNAVKYLLTNSALFKKQGIILNEEFLSERSCQEIASFIEGASESENNEHQLVELNVDNESGEVETNREHQGIQNDFHNELASSEVAGNVDTLLQSYDNTLETLVLAPGENNKPISIFMDNESEFLSFPTIYCGHTRPSNSDRSVPVHYSNVCKWELRNVDRRAATSVPNLFYKLKKLQIKQIKDKVYTALRKVKGKKHNQYTVKELLSPGTIDKLVNLNEGYRILRSLRGSPPYYEQMKKDLFAMIRQLGLPTFFCSFSAAETKWLPLLQLLGQLIDKKSYEHEDITNMSWIQKCRLIKADPVTCARYFDHRMNTFVRNILCGKMNPIDAVMLHADQENFEDIAPGAEYQNELDQDEHNTN